MKNCIKEHFFQLISLIPVCFIAIGAFVLNIYLHQFEIIDIALFDSKTIFVGFVAVLQIVCYFFLFCTFFGDLSMVHGYKLYVINMLWKPVLFAILVYSFLGNGDILELTYSGGKYYLLRMLMAISIISFIGLIYLHGELNIADLKNKKDKRVLNIVVDLEFFSTYGVSFYFIGDHIFQGIVETYMNLSLVCVIFAVIIVYGKFPLINKEKESSFFRLGDKLIKLDYYCAYFFIIIFFMIALALYAVRVYPHISNNLGGGYYKYNSILFEDNSSVTGKIIYSNSNYVYMIEEENQLSQYSIDKIKRSIVMDKTENVSKDKEDSFFEFIEDEDLDMIE